jgi:hypothetical protein
MVVQIQESQDFLFSWALNVIKNIYFFENKSCIIFKLDLILDIYLIPLKHLSYLDKVSKPFPFSIS